MNFLKRNVILGVFFFSPFLILPQMAHSAPRRPRLETYRVINETSGIAQYVKVTRSTLYARIILPVIIMVPGGLSDSTTFDLGAQSAQNLADQGFVVVTYDPDGRGKTLGVEDYNGFIHQDGLAAVVKFAATSLPNADYNNVGIYSSSRGIIIASGMFARHPTTLARYLIDWEGPSDRYVCGCGDPDVTACTDDAFWAEREASNFILSILVPYQRIQSEIDHVQANTEHAVQMINAAADGTSPWTRLNDDVENLNYITQPVMLADSTIDSDVVPYILRYADDIMALGLW